MFLRKRGHRIDLLHSVRDGRGKVRHRRLFQFPDVTALAEHLLPERWEHWKGEIQLRCPEIRFNEEQLRGQAEVLAAGERAVRRQAAGPTVAELRRACRVLRAAKEDPELWAMVGTEFQALGRELVVPGESQNSEFPQVPTELESVSCISRKRLDPADPGGAAALRELDSAARSLYQQGRVEASVALLQRRVASDPAPSALAAYGAALLELGRVNDAVCAFERMPKSMAERYYNLAAAHWSQGSLEAALDRLLDGFVRERSVAESLLRNRNHDYWNRFGKLWGERAREFFQEVYKPLMVRWALSRAATSGRIVRRPLSQQARTCLLDRILLRPQLGVPNPSASLNGLSAKAKRPPRGTTTGRPLAS